jgi:hypothetical protein
MRRIAGVLGDRLLRAQISRLFVMVYVLLSRDSLEGEIMKAEKNPILRRKSMELLKEVTLILQEIIGSGDEEGFRRLETTIRSMDKSRRKPEHTLH